MSSKYELVNTDAILTTRQAFGTINNNFKLAEEYPKDIYWDLTTDGWEFDSNLILYKKQINPIIGISENNMLTVSLSETISKEARREAVRCELFASNQGHEMLEITAFKSAPSVTIPLLIRIER